MSILLWLNEQLTWFKGFFSGAPGSPSMKRLVTFLVTIVFVVTYMKVAIINMEFTDIPPYWGVVVLGLLGLNIISNKVDGAIPK